MSVWVFDPILWIVLLLAMVYLHISPWWMLAIVPIWVGLRVWQLAQGMRE